MLRGSGVDLARMAFKKASKVKAFGFSEPSYTQTDDIGNYGCVREFLFSSLNKLLQITGNFLL